MSDIIDFHTHFFPEKLCKAIWEWFETHGWPIKYQVQAEETARLLKEQGVSRYVVLNYSHKAGMSESLNAWTHAFARRHPEAIPFGAIHPEEGNVPGLLDRCFREYGFKGLKFHTHVTGIRPDDERMFPVYEKILEHDRVLLIHSGGGPSLKGYKETTKDVSGAAFTRNMLKRYPGMKVVVPHLGFDEPDEFFELMEEFPNLRMDTTMVVAGYFPIPIPWEKIERFSDRIFYGSDFPNIPYDAGIEMAAIRSSPLSREAKLGILGGNAALWLNL
ncbi:MAG TPA: amidohydrolase family protein [bacterium]|nr:amidohydrolase family protein [bacterium]